MPKPDAKFVIAKDIPLIGGKKILANTIIYRIHGCYFMDGGMLPKDYQKDFDDLIDYEEKNGSKYIVKIKLKENYNPADELRK